MRVFRRYLQNCDLKSAESVDEFIANSRFVAERIRRIYGRDSAVVHPPVDTAYFTTSGKIKYPVFNGEPYYLFVGELRTYKRPQLAIEACLRMNRRLVVIGNGEMRKQLLKMVRGRGKIEFCGGVTRDQLRYGYAHARALIFPGIEDFGMVPVEAQATGTPVLALGEGGALETVRRGETGLFFEDGTVDSLCGCIEEFEAAEFRSEACRRNALQFSEEVFIEKIKAILCNWH
jgi:glycosyltransferase involved in cell wall biosynthesis